MLRSRFGRLVCMVVVALSAAGLFAQDSGQDTAKEEPRRHRYAIVLNEPAAAAVSTDAKNRSIDRTAVAKVAAAQEGIKGALAQRKIPVLDSSQILVNAIYVLATAEEAAAFEQMPGVRAVAPLRRYKTADVRASDLANVPRGWTIAGGENNAGVGMRIGILDTGIDHTHPAFQDDTLQVPSGYPRCSGDACQFTNRKIIVARSYVERLVKPANNAVPFADDITPRDRSGHGTAAASIAAARRTQGPAASIVGVAPKAFLGNYKIFGTPGINDTTTEEVLIRALEDAFNDGMDVVSLSLGRVADFGPYDVRQDGSRFDTYAAAVQNASNRGMVIVVSAGNAGDLSVRAPALQSIDSPATANEVIAVGATTNAHEFFQSLRAEGDAPSNLRRVNALFGTGPKPGGPFTAPLRDVQRLDNNGEACEPLNRGSLDGSIALIRRGGCTALVKVQNAQRAGAIAVVIFNQTGGDEFIFPFTGLETTAIPTVMIGNSAGVALRNFLGTRNNSYPVTLDPNLVELDDQADDVAFFSSRGPGIGELNVKPDMVAPGTDMYMATQSFDPSGDLYNATRYVNAQGTSFAAPMVAGAIAVAKQRNPTLAWSQLKSLVVNTANPANLRDTVYNSGPASVLSVGAGKLDLEAALRSNVTVEPQSLYYWNSRSRQLQQNPANAPSGLQLTNIGNNTVTLTLAIQPRAGGDPGLRLAQGTLTLARGASLRVPITLTTVPTRPDIYEGVIAITGGAVPLRVPYMFVVPDRVPFDILPVYNNTFNGLVSERLGLLGIKVIDRFGFPVRGVNVEWRTNQSGGRFGGVDTQTDDFGISAAETFLGPNAGPQTFTAAAAGQTWTFTGRGSTLPVIFQDGVVNAASNQVGNGITPGMYLSIYGRGLSEATRFLSTTSLPIVMSRVSVSFEVPGSTTKIYPGRLSFVSDGQVNVQVPWELAGEPSVNLRVNLGNFFSAVQTLPIRSAAPAAFEYTEAGTDRVWVAALDAENRLITSANRARRGQVIQIYANGLGAVTNRPASGEPSPGGPVATTTAVPVVTIGGQQAQVQFSGLSPGSIGLYQVNVVVPNVGSGSQPIVISVDGQASKQVNLPVE